MKLLKIGSIVMASLLATPIQGWMIVTRNTLQHNRISLNRLYYFSDASAEASSAAGDSSSSDSSSSSDNEHVHVGVVRDSLDNPCWQDIYDDDCAMSTLSSASFVAKSWIKSMPCAEGIEDCDMAEETSRPGYEGIDDVDVMDMLGIKRAKNLGSGGGKKEESK